MEPATDTVDLVETCDEPFLTEDYVETLGDPVVAGDYPTSLYASDALVSGSYPATPLLSPASEVRPPIAPLDGIVPPALPPFGALPLSPRPWARPLPTAAALGPAMGFASPLVSPARPLPLGARAAIGSPMGRLLCAGASIGSPFVSPLRTRGAMARQLSASSLQPVASARGVLRPPSPVTLGAQTARAYPTGYVSPAPVPLAVGSPGVPLAVGSPGVPLAQVASPSVPRMASAPTYVAPTGATVVAAQAPLPAPIQASPSAFRPPAAQPVAAPTVLAPPVPAPAPVPNYFTAPSPFKTNYDWRDLGLAE